MRRLSAVGAAIVMCLALGGVQVAAQTTEAIGVQATVAQKCVGQEPCLWTASDPRLPDTLTHDWVGSVDAEGGPDLNTGFTWMDVRFDGPEGGWSGHVYAIWGEPTANFLVLSGTGANEGWHYVASGIDPEPDGDFEWTGTLYEGELPPFPVPSE